MAGPSDVAALPRGLTAAVTGLAASTASGGTMTVTIGAVTVTCYVARGLAPAVGDVVLVHRQGALRWVTAVLFTAAPAAPADAPDAPPAPKPAVVSGSLVVAPTSTGSYRSGKWRTDTDDIIQGVTPGQANSTGAVFYGTKPASLAGATVTKATLRVRRGRGGVFAAQTATLWLVTQKTRPAGAPTLTLSTTGPAIAVGATQAAFVVPTAWAQQIVDGTAGGLAVFDAGGAPYVRFAGRSSYSPSFTLTISWTR